MKLVLQNKQAHSGIKGWLSLLIKKWAISAIICFIFSEVTLGHRWKRGVLLRKEVATAELAKALLLQWDDGTLENVTL